MGCTNSTKKETQVLPEPVENKENVVTGDSPVVPPEELTASIQDYQSVAKTAHTEKYHGGNRKFLRRGITFNIVIQAGKGNLSREYLKQSILRLQSKLTKDVVVTPAFDVKETEGNYMLVTTLDVTAPFGLYKVEITVGEQKVDFDGDVVILFNPWNEKDLVHLGDEKLLNEYILSDHGLVYTGGPKQITKRGWVFGQFEPFVLDSVFIVLAGTNEAILSDPIRLSRAMSAKVNCQDDNGILMGNWSGNYEDGTAPFKWTGSTEILHKYATCKGSEPVRYGQCWVFSGVLTSCMRCIGVPCRSVTNYSSGHDTQCNKTLDRYFYKDGTMDERKTNDSVWNFHVWNEVWMDRPDLKPGRGGWQAIDSTPQETSDGIYQTGPSSLAAIKEGEDGDYDNKFLFAEVNADIRHWMEDETKESGYRLVRTDPKSIGVHISTKSVGSDKREDVTLGYKYPEGSAMERAAVLHDLEPLEDQQCDHNLEFLFQAEPDGEPILGSDIGFTFEIKKQDDSKEGTLACKPIQGAINIYATDYTGNERSFVKSFTFKSDASPFAESFKLDENDYLKFVHGPTLALEAICHTIIDPDGASVVFNESQVLTLSMPSIELEVPKESLVVGTTSKVKFKFRNPLQDSLGKCTLYASGAGLVKDENGNPFITVPIGDVKGKQSYGGEITIKPTCSQQVRLVVTINPEHAIHGIEGSVVLVVE